MYIQTSQQEKVEMGFGGYTCNWGLHICGLYETEAERDEIIFGFLHRGALDGDLQLYCPVEQTKADFIAGYADRFPEGRHQPHDPELFVFSSASELYCPDGAFSPVSMDRGLRVFYGQSQRNGRRNVRTTAEMIWALQAMPGIEHLMAYEARLNYFIPGKPWVSICLYNLTKFSGKIIMNVLRTHPYAISGGVITHNPYYQDPNEWLKENDPRFALEDNA